MIVNQAPTPRARPRPSSPGAADARPAGRAGRGGGRALEGGGARLDPARRHPPADPRRAPCGSSRTWRRASRSPPPPPSRTIPVRTLEENRRLLNKHREAAGQGKVSFTHLVAWAILRALDTFPRMNDAYAEVDGQPHRIQRDQVRLGIAVDVQKKDGSRTLLVPNIKDAQKLELRRVPEGLRRPRGPLAQGHDLARRLHGHHGLAHEPGHGGHDLLGAAPHARPGRHRRDRRPRLPGRVQVDGPAHARAPRHQQGDDGDVHLRPPHHPGRGVGPLPRRAWRTSSRARTASTTASSRTSACRTGR